MNDKNITNLISKYSLKKLFLVLLIFIFGAIAVIAARFILVEKQSTHYHANFALYVNGQKEEFSSFVYYEEVSACTDEYIDNPKSRVHLHDKVNNLVHVHDKAATWSHFFSNLGITFADGILFKSGFLFQDSQDTKFTYILNGNEVDSIADQVIGNGDSLLINIGDEDKDTVKDRYEQIIKNANEYNEKPDPSSCSGSNSESFSERLTRTLTK
jgi:hypothetical protein